MAAKIKRKPVKTQITYTGDTLTVAPLGGRVYHLRLTSPAGEVVGLTWESKSYRRAWIAAYQLSIAFNMGRYAQLNHWIKTKFIEYD